MVMKKSFLFIVLSAMFLSLTTLSCNNKKESAAGEQGSAAAVAVNADGDPYVGAVNYSLKNGNKSNEYLNVIPADAMLVVKLDVGNVLRKSQVLNNMAVRAMFENAMVEAPEKMKSLLRGIYSNPSASGIDVERPMYFAVSNLEPAKGVLTAPVSSVKLLEQLLAAGLDEECSLLSVNGMKCMKIDGNEVVLAYDANKLMLVFDEHYANVASYMQLAAADMAVKDAKFAQLFSGDEDVEMIVNFEPVIDEASRQKAVEAELMPVLTMFSQNKLYASLNAENGYIALDMNIDVSKEAADEMAKLIKRSPRKHLKYVPGNSLFVMNYCFDMTQIYNILSSTGALNMLASNGVNSEMTMQMLEALSGEYTLALWPEFAPDGKSQPAFMLAIDCADRTLYDLLVSLVAFQFNARMVESDVYAIKINKDYEYDYNTGEYVAEFVVPEYYIVYKQGMAMFMPASLYAQMKDGDGIKPLKNSAAETTPFASANNHIVLSADAIGDMLKKGIEQKAYGGNTADQEIALEVVSIFKSLNIDFNFLNLSARLYTVDSNVNALKLIVDRAVGIAIRNMNR